MMQLTNPAVVRALMREHGLRPSKTLGQNFIVNPGVCPHIVAESGAGPGVGALEIGPGVGVLTAELAQACERVVAVELDERLLPLLGETLAGYGNVHIEHGDILKVDLPALLTQHFAGLRVIVCANLPYYITTPILTRLLEAELPVERYTFMMQKEVAQRVCAPLPSRAAGALTAAIHYRTEPKLLFTVSPGSFLPPPDVDSAVVGLRVRERPAVAVRDEARLFRVVRAAFGQRRKTLLNALSAGLNCDKETVKQATAGAGVNPGARAEQLSLEEFGRLADAFGEI